MGKRISAKKYRRTRQNEHSLQVQCVKWFRYTYTDYVIFAIPNGGSRNAIEGKKLKEEGVLSGVADLCVMLDHGRVIWIEMKTPKGRQQETQKAFEQICIELHHEYYVCKSFDQFREIIGKYL